MIGITNAYADGDSLVLIGRTDTGELLSTRRPAERSLFLNLTDVSDELYRDLKDARAVRSIRKEGAWVRVIANGDLRRGILEYLTSKGIQTYEGDVSPVRRYFADSGALVARPRRAFIDFEADARHGFNFGTMRMVSWSCVYEDGTASTQVLTSDTNEAERNLLLGFWDAIQGVDQICAWNGDRFDFPFLEARSTKQGILIDRRRWLWMDMMLCYKRLGRSGADGDEKESIGLDAVSQVVLGEGKTEVPAFILEKYGKHRSLGSLSYEMWSSGGEERALLERYNLHDAELMLRIEKKIGVLSMHDAICQACQVLPDTYGLFPTQHVEGFMLRLGAERSVHFRTRFREEKEEDEHEEKFRGAYVMEPSQKGIIENVHVADFSSMYPSIILTWNLSTETKDMMVPVEGPIPPGRCRTPETKIGFRNDVEGLLPMALKTMLKLRKEWSDKKAALTPGTEEWTDAGRRSDGYKIAANSFYGVLGNRYSRFCDRDVAESVSTTGAWLIKQVMKEAEARDFHSIYGDTDSAMIGGKATKESFAEFVDYLNKEALPRWAREMGCHECYLKIAYEKAFAVICFLGKKRYAGRYDHYKGKAATVDSKPEVRGLEYRRGDTGRLARAFQKQVIYDLLGIGKPAILDPVYYDTLIKQWQEKVLDKTLDELEISFSKSLSKPLEAYAAKIKKDGGESALPAHVQVGKILRERGENIYEGSRITYYVSDGSAKPTKYSPIADFNGECDRFYLWEHAVWPPVERILVEVFPSHNWKQYSRVRPRKMRSTLPGQLPLFQGRI